MQRAFEHCARHALRPLTKAVQASVTAESAAGVSWLQRSCSTSALQDNANTSTILEHPQTGRQIHLLGCVHGSDESAAVMRSKILDLSPSTVVLPICDLRLQSILNGSPVFPQQMFSMFQDVLKQTPSPVPIKPDDMFKVIKSWFQGLGLEPGIVLQAAVQAAHHKSAAVVCAEEQVHMLLQEVGQAMSAEDIRSELIKRLQAQMTSSDGPIPEFLRAAEEEGMELNVSGIDFALKLEAASTRRTARALAAVLKELLPEIVAVMLDKRDEQMTQKILEAGSGAGGEGPVVAVTGLMHLDGVERRFVESHLDAMYAEKYIG